MSGISPTSSASAITWHENAFLEIEEEYKRVDQYFCPTGSYDYENDWAFGAAMCQQAIDKCEKIIQEVSQSLSTPSIDGLSIKKNKILNQQVNIFLNHFKTEKACAKTSSWAIPLHYGSGVTLVASALLSIYSLVRAPHPFSAFFNNLVAFNTLSGITSKVAPVALMVFYRVGSYNTKRLEKRNNDKDVVDNLIKENKIMMSVGPLCVHLQTL